MLPTIPDFHCPQQGPRFGNGVVPISASLGYLGGKGCEVMLGTWLRTKLSWKIGRMR